MSGTITDNIKILGNGWFSPVIIPPLLCDVEVPPNSVGKIGNYKLLKREYDFIIQYIKYSPTYAELVNNENVILCERGLRTFETGTRFTLDLCGVAWLQEYTNLPIILDPSHAMGYAYGVPSLARACVAMGIDGLLIEAHPNPKVAKSDASQQLNHSEFKALVETLRPVASSVGYIMI